MTAQLWLIYGLFIKLKTLLARTETVACSHMNDWISAISSASIVFAMHEEADVKAG